MSLNLSFSSGDTIWPESEAYRLVIMTHGGTILLY